MHLGAESWPGRWNRGLGPLVVSWALLQACADDDAAGFGATARPNLSTEAGSDEESEVGETQGSTDGGGNPAGPLTSRPSQRFTEVAGPLGLAALSQGSNLLDPACHKPWPDYVNPPAEDCWIRETAGGAAIADFDGDGWPDIFVPQMAGPSALLRNINGQAFEDVAPAWGLAEPGQLSGAAWADLDLDGDLDLVVSGQGINPHRIYERRASAFVRVADDWQSSFNQDDGVGGTSIQVADFDLDGAPDLLFLEWTHELHKGAGKPWNVRLLKNTSQAGQLHFVDQTLDAGLGKLVTDDEPNQSFSASLSDFDGDGFPDLFLTADFGHMHYFRGGVDGFTHVPDSGVEVVQFGMGMASADIDGDGDLDAYVASIGNDIDRDQSVDTGYPLDRNHTLLNDGSGHFDSVEDMGDTGDCGFAWGVLAADLNNDGRVDLASTNGWTHFDPFLDASYRSDRNCLFLSDPLDPSRVLTRQSEAVGFADRGQGRGLYSIDFDRDGDLDLLQIRSANSPLLWENAGLEHHAWLHIEPESPSGAVDARDSLVAVKVDDKWRLSPIGQDSTFLGHGELRAAFGFGTSDAVETSVRVCWQAAGVMVQLDGVGLRQKLRVTPDDALAITEPCALAILRD